ncbi:MAG: hypothetical protein EKK63_09015 [Acinetobacter sp.]|uniref:hypothetical protein n=1 Tax=Acinetobacter sp. TaxID=472 RepID=UPI000F99FA95|nr:hypothetical protein [Acinetobacter sp.]RUP39768.1 MAG: hypothetical protein EKK63_09015 [Acinetobacter sp.]
MNIQFVLSGVNYTDYLHVTATKIATNVKVWEAWFPAPFTSLVFQATGLDADNYRIDYYDAPDDSSLGTLVMSETVSGLSSAYEYEKRFYEGGALPSGASIDVTNQVITDPYLAGKEIHAVFAEGFRELEVDDEYETNSADGEITLLGTRVLSYDEKLLVTIRNKVGNGATASNGLYTGTLNVSEATKTLANTDKNKRIRLVGTLSKQVINLPALSSISVDDGFYFDNACGGTAVQPKLLANDTDRIRFNGFNAASNEFAEFWVGRGEFLLLRKFDDDYWEVITEYKGVNVGESFLANHANHPNTIPGNGNAGQVALDGDEYGRVWWWLNNVLPSNNKISSSSVNSLSYTHPANEVGKWVVHPSLKLFRPPNTQGLTNKMLDSFSNASINTTAGWLNGYPGGYQQEMVGPHTHNINIGATAGISDDANDRSVMVPATPGDLKTTNNGTGTQNRVNSVGKIELYRI